MTITNDEIVRLVAEGISCGEIARRAGVSRQTILERAKRLQRLGLIAGLLPRGRQPGPPSRIEIDGDVAWVELTRGARAAVDLADVDTVSAYKWHLSVGPTGHKYAATRSGPRHVTMHRVLTGAPDGMVVDHADGDGLNNRRTNIRVCTQAENMRNRRGTRDGLKGVTFNQNSRRWVAQIGVDGAAYYLGAFDTEREAAAAYDEAARRLHGEFAYTNDNACVPAKATA